MGAPDHGRVHVARVERDRTTCGDRLGNGPVERIVEHPVGIDDSTPKDTPPTLIVIVAQQTGFAVEDQAGRGGSHIADVRLPTRPRRTVVR